MLGGPGADFLRTVAFWSIRSSGLLRWFCATGAALRIRPGITLSWQAQYFRQVEWKNRNWHEAVSSALNFPFLKEVSQNCFVFDVVNFEKWGSLAEVLRFWRCQVQKLDDGWPESVEEQGLLLLVWRHHIAKQYIRRKFRSQTSDNMERWKAEQGRGKEKRKIRRERVRRQKIQMREKVGKSRNTVFFQWFVAPEGRKVGSLKRRVRSQLARWEMKN